MEIQGKVALVTGGASGLGLATVRALAEEGASIVVLDLPSSNGETVAKELGEVARFAAADVTVEKDVRAAVDLAATEFGGLHVVVNCAGVGFPGRVLTREGEATDLERFEFVIKVNLIGTFNVVRLAAAQIANQEPIHEERGVIVNTASIAAFDGQIGQAAYAASKSGIVGMTLPIARDLATRLIRCVAMRRAHSIRRCWPASPRRPGPSSRRRSLIRDVSVGPRNTRRWSDRSFRIRC